MLVNSVKLFGSDRSEEDRVEWHVVTGEDPPQTGGVSDYTHQISRELVKGEIGCMSGRPLPIWKPSTKRPRSFILYPRDLARDGCGNWTGN